MWLLCYGSMLLLLLESATCRCSVERKISALHKYTFMSLSEFILTLLTLSTSLNFSNFVVNSASIFFDGFPPTAPVIFFNELPWISLLPPAEFVLLCTRLLREFLSTCGGVMELEDAFSCISGSRLLVGVHEAGRTLWALVGVVGVVSLLAMPSSPKLALLESDRLDRRGDVVQLAALAESAYSV